MQACSLPSLRYMAVSIGCVNKVHPPVRVVCMTCVHDMCESGGGGGGGGGGPRAVHACGCVHAIFEGL